MKYIIILLLILIILNFNNQLYISLDNNIEVNDQIGLINLIFISQTSSSLIYKINIQTQIFIPFSSTETDINTSINKLPFNFFNDISSLQEQNRKCCLTSINNINKIFHFNKHYIYLNTNEANQYVIWIIKSHNNYLNTYYCFILIDAYLLGIMNYSTTYTSIYQNFYISNDIKHNVYNYESEIGYTLISLSSFKSNEVVLIGNEIPNISTSTSDIVIYTLENTSIDDFIDNIYNAIILGIYSNTSIMKIESLEYTFIFYKSNNKINDDIPIINLGECENILKHEYNIIYPNEIFIAQIIFHFDSLRSFKYRLYDKTGNELDESYCKKLEVSNIPIYELNIIGTAVKDNLKEQINNNDNLIQHDIIYPNTSLCEDNCDDQGYFSNSINCNCLIHSLNNFSNNIDELIIGKIDDIIGLDYLSNISSQFINDAFFQDNYGYSLFTHVLALQIFCILTFYYIHLNKILSFMTEDIVDLMSREKQTIHLNIPQPGQLLESILNLCKNKKKNLCKKRTILLRRRTK